MQFNVRKRANEIFLTPFFALREKKVKSKMKCSSIGGEKSI
jgi:hypothetical protein